MRIAICFSGQIRTAVESSKNLLRYFGDLNPDIFIHTWNINDDKYTNKMTYISQDKIEKLKSIYNPKVIVVDDFNEIDRKEGLHRPYGMFYSFMRSVDIKTQYELDNGFQYDYVIKLRMDLIFDSHRRLEKDIQEFPYHKEFGIWIENPPRRFTKNTLWVDDVCFIGTSETMNINSKYYIFLKETTEGIYPRTNKTCQSTYLINNGVTIFNYERHEDGSIVYRDYLMIGYTVYREKHFHLCPLNDFDKIVIDN